MLFRRRSTRSTLRPAALLARADDARATRHRRASVIILALAVLAVIAVAGVAYVTVVRLDRSSASSYAETVNYQQQVNAVIEEIRALLTADLFGNKIVNTTTPRRQIVSDPGSAEVWPRAFEDGEHFDYPQVALYREGPGSPTADDITFDTRRPNQLSAQLQGDEAFVLDPSVLTTNGAATDRYAIALQDDAWLAPIEPVHIPRGVSRDWNVWPQITNLRSAYRYQQPRDSTRPGYWVRDDGLYVDLAQWFIQQTTDMRGNPSARLSRDGAGSNAGPWSDPIIQRRYVNDPVEASRNVNGPVAGMFQQALERSMSELDKVSPSYINETFDLADERMWVDTDGDGFPDARWQQLDSLGELFGLRWVVAARIVDNSALANVNAHLSLSSPTNPSDDSLVGDGTTPADVDLFRLLVGASDSAGNSPYPDRTHPDVRAGDWNRARMLRAFSRGALVNGLAVDELMGQLESERRPGVRFKSGLTRLYSNPAGDYTSGMSDTTLGNSGSLTRAQKEAFWRFFGASPVDPIATRGSGFPVADEIDLRTYNGNNYESLLSKLEQSCDYSDDGSFLPPATGNRAVGVLRSSVRGAIDRYRNPSDPQREPLDDRIERVRTDVRRLLTTVSGAGNAGPIPATSPVPKVPLTPEAFLSGTSGAPSVNGRTVKDAFQAFVWALAPFATDRPMIRGQTREQLAQIQVNPTTLRDVSYGGGSTGPAATANYQAADYSVQRAASLATNLASALTNLQTPAIVRLYPDVARTDNPITSDVVEMGVGFQHGAIGVPQGASDPDGVPFTTTLLSQGRFGAADTGVTLFGMTRNPFVTEAVSVAVYRNDDAGGTAPEYPVEVDPANLNDHLGSILAIELANPWTETIDLAVRRFQVIIRTTGFEMILPLDGSSIIDGDTVIQPGRTLVLMWASHANAIHDPVEWEEFIQGWKDEVQTRILPGAGGLQGVTTIDPDALQTTPPPSSTYIPWQSIATSGARLPVALVENLGSGASPTRILIDRMTPKLAAAEPFPRALEGATNAVGGLNGGAGERGSGRFCVGSNLKRPKGQGANPGFPSFVIERPDSNETLKVDPAPQIWRLLPLASAEDPFTYPPGDMGLQAVAGTGAMDDANDFGEALVPLPNLPRFELFLPPPAAPGSGLRGGAFAAASELGMLATFCTKYMNSQAGVGLEGDALLMASIGDRPAPGPMSPGQWVTLSEQLGFDENFPSSPTTSTSFATLDFGRFIPTATGAPTTGDLDSVDNLPDSMAVPLATRVFDCFDALSDSSRLVNGRININTAPREVLEILPFLDPLSQFMGPNVYNAVSAGGTLAAGERVQNLLRYRDRKLPTRDQPQSTPPQVSLPGYDTDSGAADYPYNFTNLPGLRTPASDQFHRPRAAGLASTGELSIMGRWDQSSREPDPAASAAEIGMLALAVNGDAFRPIDTALPIDVRGSLTTTDSPPLAVIDSYEATDDAEERLALFRPLSNIVTTRSDVFTAWFVVRGYSPADIESIRTDLGSDEAAISRYFNGGGVDNRPPLRPAFEQRWLAVLDRSNVRSATDRPRVLLLVELPIDKPAAVAN